MSTANEIIRVLCEIDDFATMKRFLSEILTPVEIRDVALRWRLMNMLHDRVPQRKIASELGISLCKITRGSRVLKTRGSVSKRILDQRTGERHAFNRPASKPARP
nr:transcriptional regulator [candidate division Zixibacteria bacterium]